MAGLDLGTLASYHRRDLVNEMRKARISGSDERQSISHATGTGRQEGIGVRLMAMLALLAARVREHQAMQNAS